MKYSINSKIDNGVVMATITFISPLSDKGLTPTEAEELYIELQHTLQGDTEENEYKQKIAPKLTAPRRLNGDVISYIVEKEEIYTTDTRSNSLKRYEYYALILAALIKLGYKLENGAELTVKNFAEFVKGYAIGIIDPEFKFRSPSLQVQYERLSALKDCRKDVYREIERNLYLKKYSTKKEKK